MGILSKKRKETSSEEKEIDCLKAPRSIGVVEKSNCAKKMSLGRKKRRIWGKGKC